ncbi:MAG: exonuclease domain-containing protein [Bacteroidia bacterium]|nr:exonuclease domain-containing protein [Bacteroidia bacterium]
MKYIVLDLEATCWFERNKNKENEIIEIGALKINEEGKVVSEFEKFIKPVRNPILSEFCIELTTISQKEVDDASTFPKVIEEFQEWIGVGREEYFLCSWGFYDKKQFEKDCNYHDLDISWLKHHISIKHQHQRIKGLIKPLGMGHALKMDSFTLEGTHHRGIDDARNIAKIFIKYLNNWSF